MRWFGGAAFVLALSALMSPADAAPQVVVGVEMDYSLALVRELQTEQELRELAWTRRGPPMRSVEVYGAPLAWDIGDGQGHLRIARIEFAAARNLDDAVREMATLVTSSAGQVFKRTVTSVSVSGLEARHISFEKDHSGWRLGGELLVVSDMRSNTMWQIQVLFARRWSASLDQDRERANTALASVRVVEVPNGQDRGQHGAGHRSQASVGCTLGESEDKVRQLIYALDDLPPSDKGKADQIHRRFMEAFNRYLEASSDQELERHAYCRTLDALLAELNR